MKSKISKIGIIGGSGIDKLIFSDKFETHTLDTQYGEVLLEEGEIAGKTVFFLNRHRKEYVLPSEINYQANITAMQKAGVDIIIATAAVGSVNSKIQPGDLAVLGDFLDFTKGNRKSHIAREFFDVSEPYNLRLNEKILDAAKALNIKMYTDAIYACTEGPRFESKAEIRMYDQLGASVVGMTQVPEVVLASEAKISYAVIAIVSNLAAGVKSDTVTAAEAFAVIKEKAKTVSQLMVRVIQDI